MGSHGIPGSKKWQGGQHRPADSGRNVGPSAIPQKSQQMLALSHMGLH